MKAREIKSKIFFKDKSVEEEDNYILDFHLLDTSIIPLDILGFIVLFL